MNKYAEQAARARAAGKQRRMCLVKRRFDSAQEAEQKGQRVYQCPCCGGWHRSGAEARLIAELKRRAGR